MEAAGRRYIQHSSRSDVFTLWFLGDIHLGAPGCEQSRLKADLMQIAADPHSFWIGMGDNWDAISHRDKRFAADALDDEAKLNIGRLGKFYAEKIESLFRPARHNCLGLLLGNHELKYGIDNDQEDLHAWLCQELEVQNLRYSSILDLVFIRRSGSKLKLSYTFPGNQNDKKSNVFRVYVHHGSGGAATPGGKLNTLIKHMAMVDADIYAIGHVHDQKAQRMIQLGANADCTKITERQRLGVVSGAYLKTYQSGVTGYGEQKGYAPCPLGPAKVRIWPDKRIFKSEI